MTALAAMVPVPPTLAKSPARQQTDLALAYLVLVAAVCAMSLVGLGALARPLYMLAGMGFAWAAMRRSPWLYLSATLWFWLVTAFVRRFIEWRAGFNPTDVILATPNLMMLFMLRDILTTPGLLGRRGLGPGLAVAAAVSYGICNSFFRGDVVPGVVAAADWFGPLLYFFYINVHADKIRSLEPHLRTFLSLNLGVMLPYGIYQYLYMPEWDALWMLNSDMRSIGRALPMSSRVFGTTNNPAFLANWLGVCLLLTMHFRSRTMAGLVPFATFLLFATLVRSTWGSIALALIVSAMLGKGQVFKSLFMALAVLVTLFVGLAVVSPIVADQVTARLESMQNLDQDDSAQIRKLIYQQTPEIIDSHPLGLGIGALGRGAVTTSSQNLVHIDSGILSTYLALGWVAGTLYITGLLFASGQALAAIWRYQSSLLLAIACAAVSTLALFPFNNIVGFEGSTLWMFLGYAMALTACYQNHGTCEERQPPKLSFLRCFCSDNVCNLEQDGHVTNIEG